MGVTRVIKSFIICIFLSHLCQNFSSSFSLSLHQSFFAFVYDNCILFGNIPLFLFHPVTVKNYYFWQQNFISSWFFFSREIKFVCNFCNFISTFDLILTLILKIVKALTLTFVFIILPFTITLILKSKTQNQSENENQESHLFKILIFKNLTIKEKKFNKRRYL